MKNKKGLLLLGETLKILLAIISIGLLIYLSVSLIGIFTQKSKIEQARATLDELTNKINALEEGKSTNYLILSPKDWYLVSFYFEDPSSKEIYSPDSCSGKRCLCICSLDELGRTAKSATVLEIGEICNQKGVCQEVDESVEISGTFHTFVGFLKIDINNILLTKKGDKILIEEYSEEARNLFTELLAFKINDDSLPVEELITKYIKGRGDANKKSLKDSLNLFFEKEKIKGGFSIIDNSASYNIMDGPLPIFDYYKNAAPFNTEEIDNKKIVVDGKEYSLILRKIKE